MLNKSLAVTTIVVSGFMVFSTQLKPANAEKPISDADSANYQIEVLKDGSIARLNKKNGTMSLCTVKDEQMICRLAVDERDAYEEEIAALSKALENGSPALKNRTAEETKEWTKFNRAMEFSQEAMRRFYGVIEDLRKEYPDIKQESN